MDVIFTIVSRNYAAQAASLMESLALAEPGARRVVVATDGPIPSLAGRCEVIPAETLDAPFAAMTVYYDALELNTAVKPYAFRKFLGEAETVTYLDPDIWVYRPLDPVREGLARAELCLTPHLMRPLKGEANPNDKTILQSGTYNLGFLSVRRTPAVLGLIDWWAEKCRFDCRVDFAAGLFTDQRWMDLAPSFVDTTALLRRPDLNLAYWNLEGRTLSREGGEWQVEGQPLTFFHFSGFDPERPELLSKHQDRTTVAPGSALQAILAEYAGRMLKNGHATTKATPYAHAVFASGRPVTRAMRRTALAAARSGEEAFADGLSARVEAWLDAANAPPQGVRDPDPAAWAEPPWTGAPAAAFDWMRGLTPEGLPRACAALLAGRSDLRARTAGDAEALLALCLGPEALAGRFDAGLLPDMPLDALRPAALRAAQLAYSGPDDPLKRALFPGFGLAAAARWPKALADTLRALYLEPTTAPAPFVRLFTAIWDARTDLQRTFPLRTFGGRLRFLRWLMGGGLAEYGVDPQTLPASVRNHPLTWAVRRSLGAATAEPPARTKWGLLVVLEDDDPRPELFGRTLLWRAGSGRFETMDGSPAATPGEVEYVQFRERPTLVPADAMALRAQGVRWPRAAGLWDATRLAELSPTSPALSFIEEVWTLERTPDLGLPRPNRRFEPHKAIP